MGETEEREREMIVFKILAILLLVPIGCAFLFAGIDIMKTEFRLRNTEHLSWVGVLMGWVALWLALAVALICYFGWTQDFGFKTYEPKTSQAESP